MHTATLALLLATTPATPTDRAPFDVSDAEVVTVDSAAYLVTFDADGEQTASLSVWVDDDGRTHVDADFADGLYMSAVTDGETVTIDSPDPAEVSARAQMIDDWLGANPPQAGWLGCAGHTAHAAVECALANPVLCVVGSVVAACECLPLIIDEWEGYSCL